MNKKGADKLLSVYWFAVIAIVAGGITAMVFGYYGSSYDIRSVEADILSGKISSCISPQGVLDEKFLETSENSENAGQERTFDAIEHAKENSVSGRTCFCEDNCDSYAGWINEYSRKNEISDPLLVLSIMMQESNCKPSEESGSSVGLMQINLNLHCGNFGLPSDREACKNVLTSNPEKNIEVGTRILRDSYNSYEGGKRFSGACTERYRNIIYSGWDAAVRGYNGWGCGKYLTGPNKGDKIVEQDYYVDEVNQRYNQLVEIAGGFVSESAYNLQEECGFDFSEEYYTKVEINEFGSENTLSRMIDGNPDIRADCNIQDEADFENPARCIEKTIYSIDEENNPYSIKILTGIRKTEENAK